MSRPELPPEFVPRLVSYGLDERARRVLRETWPLVEPALESVLDEFFASAARLPHVAAVYARHGKEIRAAEVAHFRALLNGNFDIEYHEACRRTVEHATSLGLEARGRMLAATLVLTKMLTVLGTRHRFSGAAVAERSQALARAILFDIATSSTLALRAKEPAAAS